MSCETSSLRWLRGERCAAHGGGQRLLGEARASSCPRGYVFSVPGTASNFAAPGVSTIENEADIVTKVLSATRHRELCKTDFDLDEVPVASNMTHTALCRHTGWKSLGEPDEVFSCSCATALLLTKLT